MKRLTPGSFGTGRCTCTSSTSGGSRYQPACSIRLRVASSEGFEPSTASRIFMGAILAEQREGPARVARERHAHDVAGRGERGGEGGHAYPARPAALERDRSEHD